LNLGPQDLLRVLRYLNLQTLLNSPMYIVVVHASVRNPTYTAPNKKSGPRVSPMLSKSYFLHYGFLSQLAKADLLAEPAFPCNLPSCQSEQVRVFFAGSIDACLGKGRGSRGKKEKEAFSVHEATKYVSNPQQIPLRTVALLSLVGA